MVKSHTHEMAHYHKTNINHTHEAGDRGHSHALGGYQFVVGSSTQDGGIPGGGPWVKLLGGEITTNTDYANIYINGTGDVLKPSTNSYYHNTTAERNYTASNNDNANENRPKNFTVKIWKRIA